MDTEKPYRAEVCGISCIVFAKSAGRARYRTALSAFDAGFIKDANPSLITCRRSPEHDSVTDYKPEHCYAPDYFEPPEEEPSDD